MTVHAHVADPAALEFARAWETRYDAERPANTRAAFRLLLEDLKRAKDFGCLRIERVRGEVGMGLPTPADCQVWLIKAGLPRYAFVIRGLNSFYCGFSEVGEGTPAYVWACSSTDIEEILQLQEAIDKDAHERDPGTRCWYPRPPRDQR